MLLTPAQCYSSDKYSKVVMVKYDIFQKVIIENYIKRKIKN